MIFVTLAK